MFTVQASEKANIWVDGFPFPEKERMKEGKKDGRERRRDGGKGKGEEREVKGRTGKEKNREREEKGKRRNLPLLL